MVSRHGVAEIPSCPLLGRRLLGVGVGILAWLGYRVLSARPELAESVAGTGPIPESARLLSLVTGSVPVSLAELLVALFLVRQMLGLARGVRELRSGRTPLGRIVTGGTLRLAQDVGVLVFLFYALWGFQYAREGVAERLGVASSGEVSASEVQRLALLAVDRTNELYREMHGVPDIGRPTPAPPVSELTLGLEEGWSRVLADFELPARLERAHGAPKPFLASPLVKRFGVGGMYFPYTGEALVLADLPAPLMGKSLAHEMAHQRGIASESDANVLAFLVARESPDPVSRYSAYVFLQQQLLSILQGLDPEESARVTAVRYPGVQRDLLDAHLYWEPARGIAGAAATRMNDAMLRSHGIPEGVASYRGSGWIFLALARERGEGVLF